MHVDVHVCAKSLYIIYIAATDNKYVVACVVACADLVLNAVDFAVQQLCQLLLTLPAYAKQGL